MSFQKQLQSLQSKVRFMLQAKDSHFKSKTKESFRKWMAAESEVKKIVFEKENKASLFNDWLAQ